MRLLKVLNGIPCGVRLIGNERRTAKKALKEARKRGARVAVVEYEHDEGGYLIWEDYKTMPI